MSLRSLLLALIAICLAPGAHASPSVTPIANTWGIPGGDIIVQTARHRLLFAIDADRVLSFPVGVGRRGAAWRGTAVVARKASWPAWRPTSNARRRDRRLPRVVRGGHRNPLGARALYLHRGGRDTFYRIHGTNAPRSIGRSVSSGCIRMHNRDIIALSRMVSIGAHVTVV